MKKYVIVLLIVSFLFAMGPSSLKAQRQRAADCERGLLRCSVAALLLGIGGSRVAGAVMEGMCVVGWVWCKEFMP